MGADPHAPTQTLQDGTTSPAVAAGGARGDLQAGARVGRHVVVRLIDRGGMGVVYEATDPALDRPVALKLVLGDGARDPMITARFVREARAAATLSHPNVVSIYEVGEHEGTPYLAMELVGGVTVREWSSTPRTIDDVVRVFVEAGRGLGAAHRAGVVHRDVKPDNILVGEDRARIADFGLARQLDDGEPSPASSIQSPSAPDRLTHTGSVLGTPRYMAPEQRAGKPVDGRSDQYSFCVTLLEALTRRRPSPQAQEHDLSSLPGWLRRVLARGLAREPEARWPSMEALVFELERGPWRRRRALAAAGGAALLAVGAAAIVLLRAPEPAPCQGAEERLAGVWDADAKARLAAVFGATRAPFAPAALRVVEADLDRYGAAWLDMHRAACQATRVSGAQSEEMLDRRMACLDDRRRALAVLVRSLGELDARGLERAHILSTGLPPVAACADLASLASAGVTASDSLSELIARGRTLVLAGRDEEGAAALDEALAAARAAGDGRREAEARMLAGRLALKKHELPAAIDALAAAITAAKAAGDARLRLESQSYLVQAYGAAGRFEEARAVLDVAFATLAEAPENEADLLAARGVISGRSGRFEDARRDLERAIVLYGELFGPEAHPLSPIHSNLQIVYRRLGRLDEAMAHAHRALALARQLGEDHPQTAWARHDLSTVLAEMGRPEEALRELEAAAAILRAGNDRGARSTTLDVTAGRLLNKMGRWREAAARFRAAAEAYELAGGDEAALLVARHNLGVALVATGELDEAERVLRGVIARRAELLGPGHPDVGTTRRELCHALLARGRPAEALRECGRARELLVTALGEAHPHVERTLAITAEVQRARGRFAEALAIDRALAASASAGERVEHDVALALDHLGLGAPERALPLAARAVVVFAARKNPDLTGPARWALARALWETERDRPGAVSIAREALVDLERAGTPRLVPEIRRWLEKNDR